MKCRNCTRGKEEKAMEQKIKFDYFYGKEADTFTFYRIPKLLFTEPIFKGLSSEAKI